MITADQFTAYAAGFFDGEGSVTIAYTSNPRNLVLTVAVTQNVQGPLIALQAVFGGRIYAERQRVVFSWRLHGYEAGAFLDAIRPFLIRKAKEADLALRFVGTINRHRRNARLTPEVRAAREAIFRDFRAMRTR